MSAEQIGSALKGRRNGNGWLVCCPCPNHGKGRGDRSPSLSVADGNDGRLLLRCFAGCDFADILDELRGRGLVDNQRRANGTSGDPIGNMQDRVRRTNDSKKEGKTDPPTAYIYHNADGSPRLRVNRTQHRDPAFWQEHWDGSRWIKGGGDQTRVPYRLPELLAAEHDTVLVVEGEKDADNVAALGFVATTNAGGSGNWHPDLNQHFNGKNIFILPDNDEAGEKHARTVHNNLKGIAREIKILRLPNIANSQDVSDWIAAGGTQDGLVDLLRAAPLYEEAAEEPKPSELRATPYVWRDPKDIPKREFLYGTHLIRKFGSAKFAAGGVGKSALALTEAIAMATDRALLGIAPRQRCRVWYWNGEDPREETERRIAAICLKHGITAEDLEGWFFYDSGRDQPIVIAEQTKTGSVIAQPVVRALVKAIFDDKIDVLIIDPFVSCHRIVENDNPAMDMVAKQWTAIADETNTAIELIHHTKKTGGADATVEDGRGAVALLAAVRSAQVLNKMTPDEGAKAGVDNHRQYFKVENGKANLAPPPEGKDWYHIVGVPLGNGGGFLDSGDNVGVVTAWQWPDPLDGVTGGDFDRAAVAIRAGRWRESSQAKDWVGWPIARALGFDLHGKRADKAKVAGLIKIWIGTGSLIVVEELDDKSMPRKFVQVAHEA